MFIVINQNVSSLESPKFLRRSWIGRKPCESHFNVLRNHTDLSGAASGGSRMPGESLNWPLAIFSWPIPTQSTVFQQ